MRIAQLFITSALFLTPVSAQDRAYQPGYKFGIPPGFEVAEDAAGASRGHTIFRTADDDYMEVWEADLAGRSFIQTVREHMAQSEDTGWTLTYKKFGREWVSYSGIKGSQIRYVRAIMLCDEGAAFFMIDYDKTKKTAYDPIIVRMVRSLKANCS